jgi:hypothetical protein
MDPLETLVLDLRRRQLVALRGELGSATTGHDRRVADAMIFGVGIVNDLAVDATWLQSLINNLITIAEQDERFAFLGQIPEAPVLAMMRALALEQTVFGDQSRPVAELSLLMGLFTVVLDGLLDEAPTELMPAREWLDAVMNPAAWGTLEALPPMGASHPVTQTLEWLTRELIQRLTSQPGWRQDESVRREFATATSIAYASEVESVHIRITDASLSTEEARRRVLAKSTNPIWAGALIPFCVHGWPAGIEPEVFGELARSIGAFGGWLDDVVDVLSDLRADRWSSVLLELQESAQTLPARNDDPRGRLLDLLKVSFVAGRLSAVGVERLRTVRSGLAKNGLAEEALLPALADVTEALLNHSAGPPRA